MPDTPTESPHDRTLVALLALAGLAVRLSFTLTGWHEGNLVADDAFYYFTIARHLLDGRGSTFDGLTPTNGYHPLWMGLLLGLFSVSGPGLELPLRVATTACALLDVASGWILYRLLVRCGWPGPARFAAAIWFLSPFTVFVGLRGMEASLTTLLVLLFARTVARPGPPSLTPTTAIGSGVLLGLAGLARTDTLPVLGLALAAIVMAQELARRGSAVRALGWLTGTAAAAALVTLPWFVWNQIAFGSILQVSGRMKLMNKQIYGSLGNADWSTLAGVKAMVKAAVLPVFAPARFLSGEEFEAPRISLLLAAGFILVPLIAAWRARRSIADALRTGAPARLAAFAVITIVLHLVEFGFVWRTYAVWYALPSLAFLAVLWGIAFGSPPDPMARRSPWRSPAFLVFAALCGLTYVAFFVRVPHRPRDPEGFLSRNLAAVVARYPRPIVAGAWNAGGYSWEARRYASVRVTNLDGLVNNAVFEAVRRGTYRRYIAEHVDVLFDDPRVAAKFLDSLEVERLVEEYPRWNGYEIWTRR